MISGLYVAGDTLIHRLPAGVKLAALFLAAIGLLAAEHPVSLAILLIVAAVVFVLAAGLGWSRLWAVTRPLILWLVFIAAAQWWLTGPAAAIAICVRLLLLVWLAALVTYTTRMTAMTHALTRPLGVLKPLGVSPKRVAFQIALTIRLIPALFQIVAEVREAQRARGLERAVLAAVVPVFTRALRSADSMAEALDARGYESWDA